MAKIVNSWNEWDPLKRVIIGRPEGTNVPAPEPAWWYDLPKGGFPLGQWGPFPQEMVDAANEQMDYFVAQIEKRGAIVERIDIHPFMFNKAFSSPTEDWTQLNAHGVNNVRDVTMIHGNFIVEATTVRRTRIYERFNLRPIFERYFKEDPEVVHFAAPMPMLTDESYVKNYYYLYENVWTDEDKKNRLHNWEFQLTEKEPLWDAADAMRFGKDIFHQGSCVTNKGGMDWLKRMCAALGLRLHHVLFDTPMDPKKPDNFHPWHIDVNFVPLKPGLCMYNPDWAPRTPEVWELFKKNDWELIPAARPTRVHKNKVYLTGLYEGKSWISMNTFSQDPKTVYVEAGETAYCEQLDKLGFEVVPIPYEKVIPFGGALHCTTLDVYREGDCEDYFPNQVEGY
ncbi:MAG: serine/threonine protein kinase [Desulfobacterales bacterium]|jgi:glycine amidinotransferase|nr:serine/threonine protein kinase [Desulfobacter sp.]MDP6395354.1 serine/threonine protein kinase [Desulfobacterales bacterium]MDP6682760.1 serine/threonine protein kinase [Desulfobacterales bacterium]MDP6808097.1 serine/threonine protein kinase [Desulfobacterales bacterium]|tara:strand:+ start:61333 stop:62520 length:1188 start_codon:yes stop_codon:yes gene_type:complete